MECAVFGIVEYLREQGESPREFVRWLGQRLTAGWDGVRGDLPQIAYFAALNPVSLGSELKAYEVDENEAMIQVTTGHLNAGQEDMDLIGEIYEPIMEYLGLDYEWEREGEVTTLRLRQRADE